MMAGRRPYRARKVMVCAVITGILPLAACGGEDESGTSQGLTGEPIKIGQIVDATSTTTLSFSQAVEGLKAVVSQFNADGGIDGRPIEIVSCDAKFDPNEATTCARQVVAEDVAVVFGYSFNVDRILPVLEAAETPWLGATVNFPSENTSPISFPTFSQRIVQFAMGRLGAEHCETPVILTLDSPQADDGIDLMNAGLQSQGKPKAQVVRYSPSATDYAPYVAEISDRGGDCALFVGAEQVAQVLYPAIEQLGKKFRIVGNEGGNLSVANLGLAPIATEDALVVSQYPLVDGSELAPYWEAIDTYSDRAEHPFASPSGMGTYASWKVFEAVLGSVVESGEDVTKDSMFAALKEADAVETDGVMPTLDFTESLPLEYPREYFRAVSYKQVKDGKIVYLDDDTPFEDLSEAYLGAFGTN